MHRECQGSSYVRRVWSKQFLRPISQIILLSREISNIKHQITNKFQISIFNDQNMPFRILNLGHWNLFEICILVLGILIYHPGR